MFNKRKGLTMLTHGTRSYLKKRLLVSERSSWPGDVVKGHSSGPAIFNELPKVLDELGISVDIIAIIQSFATCVCAFVLNVAPSLDATVDHNSKKSDLKAAWLRDETGECYRGGIGENQHWERFTVPKQPQPSVSPWICYRRQEAPRYILSHPTHNYADVTHSLSFHWIAIKGTSLAKPFHDLHRQDVERYKREVAAYEAALERDDPVQIHFTSTLAKSGHDNQSFVIVPNSIYNLSSSQITRL